MRSAPIFLIDFPHFGRHLHGAARFLVEPLLLLVEHGIVKTFAIDNIELTHRRFTLGVLGIVFAGCRHRPAPVNDFWISYLSRNLICLVAPIAIKFSRLGMLRKTITSLNHESKNDTMEKDAIVETFAYQFQKIVAMERCLIVELNLHRSAVGYQLHNRARFLCLCRQGNDTKNRHNQHFLHHISRLRHEEFRPS